jgi:hypothetical protein
MLGHPWSPAGSTQRAYRRADHPQRVDEHEGGLQRAFGAIHMHLDRRITRRVGRIVGVATEPHAVRRLLVALGLAAEPTPAPVLPAA